MRSQLEDFQDELEEYQALRPGRRQVLKLDSFDDLPRALVQGRIAASLSQYGLAEKLGIKEQQVQRYEASDYQSASLARVAAVVRVLGLRVQEEISLPSGVFPTLEDTVLQRAVLMVLEPIHEQDFLDCSYGFRPGRSAHQALDALWQGLMQMGDGWIIDLDIQSFFDDVD